MHKIGSGRINLENQALLRSGWRSPSIGTKDTLTVRIKTSLNCKDRRAQRYQLQEATLAPGLERCSKVFIPIVRRPVCSSILSLLLLLLIVVNPFRCRRSTVPATRPLLLGVTLVVFVRFRLSFGLTAIILLSLEFPPVPLLTVTARLAAAALAAGSVTCLLVPSITTARLVVAALAAGSVMCRLVVLIITLRCRLGLTIWWRLFVSPSVPAVAAIILITLLDRVCFLTIGSRRKALPKLSWIHVNFFQQH
jgi:hypothetical protein